MNTHNNICLNVAQKRVREYTSESDDLFGKHKEAMECRDCEEFLQKGIVAHKWLKNADEFLREADYQGVAEFTSELQDAVHTLYVAWLSPCEFAEQWAQINVSRGFKVDKLEEFRQICAEVEEIVQSREWRQSARRARILAAASEEDE